MTTEAEWKSWEEIAPGGVFSDAQLADFLAQPDECLFLQGGCHVMAAALFSELSAMGAVVYIFEAFRAGKFQHYYVGRPDLGYADVRLVWTNGEDYEVRPCGIPSSENLVVTLGRNRCCIVPTFLAAMTPRADAFLTKAAAQLAEMAQEAKRAQRPGRGS